eukprot:SAG11_NODE_3744_length_2254_cov_1.617633_3_plen_225_part_00
MGRIFSPTYTGPGESVFLFMPNHIGHLRVVLVIVAFYYMKTDPFKCGFSYLFSQFLDALDGHAARYWHQSTNYGAVLDMVTDRCATAMLMVGLAVLYPQWSFTLQVSADARARGPCEGLRWQPLSPQSLHVELQLPACSLIFGVLSQCASNSTDAHRSRHRESLVSNDRDARVGQIKPQVDRPYTELFLAALLYQPQGAFCNVRRERVALVYALRHLLYQHWRE